MESSPFLRLIIAGQLKREFILTPDGKSSVDTPGGNLLYAAAGMALWENNIGLISRVGEDYPQEWLADIAERGFDIRGTRILPEPMDVRRFVAYDENMRPQGGSPVAHFSRLGLQYPKSLLGYNPNGVDMDSRTQPSPRTVRLSDFPEDYLDATAAHLCPLDYLSHTLLPPALRQGHVATVTLDPSPGYMNPTFWDDIPQVLRGVTAFLCNEEKLSSLFTGRSSDPWEIAAALAAYGCEIVVIKRGASGQYLYDHSRKARWVIPAYPARVKDPTGAGDAFCGGFLAGIRSRYDPLEACLTGNISASFVIEGSGPFFALDAFHSLVDARLESLRDKVRRI